MPLEHKTSEDLMKMLHNIIRRQNESVAQEKKVILYNEWSNRNESFLNGRNIKIMSADGVLSAFGYRVGDGGVTKASRRQSILKHIMEAPIPPIVSVEYTKAWGKPNTSLRKKKLLKTLKGFIYGVKQRSSYAQHSYERAVSHWKQDLDYIQGISV